MSKEYSNRWDKPLVNKPVTYGDWESRPDAVMERIRTALNKYLGVTLGDQVDGYEVV